MFTAIKTSLMEKADNMAASAASFNSHGYDNFIQARKTLMDELNEVFEKEIQKVLDKQDVK